MANNCIIAQSGGPTAAINASLAGVISKALKTEKIDTVYGSLNGIQGVLSDRLVALNDIFGTDERKLERLKFTPSMFLGSCRYKLADYKKDPTDYDKICEMFRKYDIKYFFYIGGNDSMDTVAKLSVYTKEKGMDVKVFGCPKTIDNDLTCTDHTPGFGSAAKYIATTILEVAHDTSIYDMPTVVIVEIMGRNAGWLTAAASLARNEYNTAPQLIYLPERVFSADRFAEDVKKELTKRQHVIVAVSEGIKDENGNYISAQGTKTDKFGHVMLAGTGKVLEDIVKEKIGCKVRSIELTVLQRAADHIASLTDINESFTLGSTAVDFALAGETGKMVTCVRVCDEPYKVVYDCASIDKIANYEKTVPEEWINEAGNDVIGGIDAYLRPLIQGEVPLQFHRGLPDYLGFDLMYRSK